MDYLLYIYYIFTIYLLLYIIYLLYEKKSIILIQICKFSDLYIKNADLCSRKNIVAISMNLVNTIGISNI